MTALLGVNSIHRVINIILFIALIGAVSLSLSEKAFGQSGTQHSDITQIQLHTLFSKPFAFDDEALKARWDALSNVQLSQQANFLDGQQLVRDMNGNYFVNQTLEHTQIQTGSNELTADVRLQTFYQVHYNNFYLDNRTRFDGTPVIRRALSSGSDISSDPIVVGVDIQIESDDNFPETADVRARGKRSRDSGFADDGLSRSSAIGGGAGDDRYRSSERVTERNRSGDGSYRRESSFERDGSSGDASGDRDYISAQRYYYLLGRNEIDRDAYYVIGDRAYPRDSSRAGSGSERESFRESERFRDGDGSGDDFSGRERRSFRSESYGDGDAGDRDRDSGRYAERETVRERDRDRDSGRYAERETVRERDSGDRAQASNDDIQRRREAYRERLRNRNGDRDGGSDRKGDYSSSREREVIRDRDAGNRDRDSGRYAEREVIRDRDAGNRDRDSGRYAEREVVRDREAGNRDRDSGRYAEREVVRERDNGDRAQASNDDIQRRREAYRERLRNRDGDRDGGSDRGGDYSSSREREVIRDRDAGNRDRDNGRYAEREVIRDRDNGDRSSRYAEREGSREPSESDSDGYRSYYQENRDLVWEEHKFIYESDFGSGTYAELAQDTYNMLYWMDDAASFYGYDVVKAEKVHDTREVNIGGEAYYLTKVGNGGWFGHREWVITRGLTINGEKHHRLVSEFEHDLVVDYVQYQLNDSEKDSDDYKYWNKLAKKIKSEDLERYSYDNFETIIDKEWIDYDLGFYPDGGEFNYSYEYYSYTGGLDRPAGLRSSSRTIERDGSNDNFREDEVRTDAGSLTGPSRWSETRTTDRSRGPGSDSGSEYTRERTTESYSGSDRPSIEDELQVGSDETTRVVERTVTRSSGLGRSGSGDGYSYFRTGKDQYAVYINETDDNGNLVRRTYTWSSEELQAYIDSGQASAPSAPAAEVITEAPEALEVPDAATVEAIRLLGERVELDPTSNEILATLGAVSITRADGTQAIIPLADLEQLGLTVTDAPELDSSDASSDDESEADDLRSEATTGEK